MFSPNSRVRSSFRHKQLPEEAHGEVRVARDVPRRQPARVAPAAAELPGGARGQRRLAAAVRPPRRHPRRPQRVPSAAAGDLRPRPRPDGLPRHVHRVRVRGARHAGAQLQGTYYWSVWIRRLAQGETLWQL